MAANKFATMLHRNTHRITLVLVYAVLEWILIILLLFNSLFSYLILKFADFFGLKSPCLWCSRLDHVFEPRKSRPSYRDLVCETHASEISKLSYCTKHGKLAVAQDMCEDCSSSRPDSQSKTFDIGRKVALFSWVKQKSMISRNGEKQIGDGDKSYRCSCCDSSLDTKLCSPYLLLKPSWGVLDYAQKANLIASAIGADNDGGEYLDRCKSDCHRDEHEMERTRGSMGDDAVYNDDEGEHQTPSDVDETDERREEAEEDSLETTELKLIDDEVEIPGRSTTDASAEILSTHLENHGDVDDHRLVPIELIDSMTAEDQSVSICRKEDQKKPKRMERVLSSKSLMDSQFKLISTQFDFILEKGNFSEGESAVPLLNENTISRLESMDSVAGGKQSEDCPENVSEMPVDIRSKILEMSEESSNWPHDIELDPSLPSLRERSSEEHEFFFGQLKDHDNAWNSKQCDTLEVETDQENVSEMPVDIKSKILEMSEESSNWPQDIELVPSLPCLRERSSEEHEFFFGQSKDHDNARNSKQCETLEVETDQDPKQAEDITMGDESKPFDRVEQGINSHLSLFSEINEVEEDRAPETPTYVRGLYHLHQKLLLQQKNELGAEESVESVEGSVPSELEGGDGVLTVEQLKSALREQRKALHALYAELEEERSASAIAANQTMAMITRLQEEKSAMQMEALQYQRMMEEQSEYDQEALQLLNDLMVKREKEKHELEKELEIYRKKALDYESKGQRMMRRKNSSGRSRTTSAYSSNTEDDELSVDLNHEVRDEDGLYSHRESSNGSHFTPGDGVPNLVDVGLECATHLRTLNESLADFEEERISILEQLKALEEKLFTLDDEEEEQFFEDIRPMEHILEQNGEELNENPDFSHQEENGVANGFSDDMDVKHHQDRRNMVAKGKKLLPLFDAIGSENDDGMLNGHHGDPNGVFVQNSLVPNFTPDDRRTAIEEEVDHLYTRLQALEEDKGFLKHCVSTLKKGDKGMDLLQEILQHLRDLRSIELRARNMSDGALA